MKPASTALRVGLPFLLSLRRKIGCSPITTACVGVVVGCVMVRCASDAWCRVVLIIERGRDFDSFRRGRRRDCQAVLRIVIDTPADPAGLVVTVVD